MAAAKKSAEADNVTTTDDIVEVEQPKASDVKYVTVTSPFGAKTTVPEDIVDALIDSGYKK